MKNEVDSILIKEDMQEGSKYHQHSLFMGTTLVVFNLILMSCVGFYWINPSVHEYISGNPL